MKPPKQLQLGIGWIFQACPGEQVHGLHCHLW
jgi:hypothetical protein